MTERDKKQSQDQSQNITQNQQSNVKSEQKKNKIDQSTENPCQEIEEELNELKEKYKQLNDRHLRLAAEYDNYRKRTLKEKAELIKNAGETILIDLLPIVDDFERAIEHIDSATDIEALKEGVMLIYRRFKEFLRQKGVQEIDALGKTLDTDLHEAVQQVEAESEDQKGKIVYVVQKGYKLNDKVIRHAKVVVAM